MQSVANGYYRAADETHSPYLGTHRTCRLPRPIPRRRRISRNKISSESRPRLHGSRPFSGHPDRLSWAQSGDRRPSARVAGRPGPPLRGVAQPGSAFGWGPKGRWFKSSRPDRRAMNGKPRKCGAFCLLDILSDSARGPNGVHSPAGFGRFRLPTRYRCTRDGMAATDLRPLPPRPRSPGRKRTRPLL
jgi:hypothetical protein